jgi:YVTN family beta-propeller protein
VVVDNQLWVANSGGYGQDNTISVIDPESNSVTNAIEVADCPKNVVVDANGDVWAVCSGFVSDYDTGETTMPGLVRINSTSKEVEETFNLPAADYGHPSLIIASMDGNSICFSNSYGTSGVWKMPVDANAVPDAPWIDELPYSMGVDPETGEIYLGISPDFVNPGYVTVYGTDGQKTATYDENIGLGPNKFIFD